LNILTPSENWELLNQLWVMHTYPTNLLVPERIGVSVPRERTLALILKEEIHLVESGIYGNPISGEGSIVTVDYGYDLHKLYSF
jgi:hypothetical protein